MNFKLIHTNLTVLDLEKSLAFYHRALNLAECKRIAPESGDFIIVYLADESGLPLLELTWYRDRKEPYDLGDNEIHVAFQTPGFAQAHALHAEMNCICYENPAMGIYFISDPDGYWLEVLPKRT